MSLLFPGEFRAQFRGAEVGRGGADDFGGGAGQAVPGGVGGIVLKEAVGTKIGARPSQDIGRDTAGDVGQRQPRRTAQGQAALMENFIERTFGPDQQYGGARRGEARPAEKGGFTPARVMTDQQQAIGSVAVWSDQDRCRRLDQAGKSASGRAAQARDRKRGEVDGLLPLVIGGAGPGWDGVPGRAEPQCRETSRQGLAAGHMSDQRREGMPGTGRIEAITGLGRCSTRVTR